MTQLLTRAFDQAAALPEAGQDELARRLLAELDADRQWDAAFAAPASDELLTRLADEALAAKRAGRTEPLDDAAFGRADADVDGGD